MKYGESRSSIAKKTACLQTWTGLATKTSGKQQMAQVQARVLPLTPMVLHQLGTGAGSKDSGARLPGFQSRICLFLAL